MPAVRGLEHEFPGKVAALNVDCTTEKSRAEIAELGFQSHGIVIRDREGAVLFKQADHAVNMEDVRSALGDLLGS